MSNRPPRMSTQSRRSIPWALAILSFLGGLAIQGTVSTEALARSRQAALAPASKSYLDRIHTKLYKVWVKRVLKRVTGRMLPSNQFNARGRKVTVRVQFSSSGTIVSSKVARRSGYQVFDTTVRHMLLMTYGYPIPPPSVRSEDGQVYLEITFYRWGPYVNRSSIRVIKLPFTRTMIPGGKLMSAVGRLTRAVRAGRLARYALSFGQEVMKLAIAHHGRAVAGELVATLDDARTPLQRFDLVLKSRLTDEQLGRALTALARRTGLVAGSLLTRSFARQQASQPLSIARTLFHLEALWKLSGAVASSRTTLGSLLGSPRPLVRAHAAALLYRFVAKDRPKAEAVALALLRGRNKGTLVKVLPLVARAGGSAAVYRRIVRLATSTKTTTLVKTAAIHALAETGRADGWKKLLTLTYTRKVLQRNTACQASRRLAPFSKVMCYRYVTFLKSKRSSSTLLTAAAHGLSSRCWTSHLTNLKRAFRSYRNAVRLGLARGLPGGKAFAEAVLLRLAKSRSKSVRHAALGNMARNPRAAYRPVLLKLVGSPDIALRRLAYKIAKNPKRLRRLWKSEPDPTLKLTVARRILQVRSAILYPWIQAHLRSTSWKRRVRAAWVLQACTR